ncbi:MAG: hypothetical protein U0263_41370 [Polyangiaceae bacterium]
MAWPANSGLNWDEKYSAWVNSLKKINAVSYGETFEITTPWGKTLPSPKLECAEVAMFMRLTFASWYNLPFFMTTTDQHGTRVYFGHFGARTATDAYSGMPRYKSAYADYSNQSPAQYQANWPKDNKLRAKGLYGGGDDMDYIAPGAKAGTYFDEVFLNKRVGHLPCTSELLRLHQRRQLAQHLQPEAAFTARRRRVAEALAGQGIGHTLLLKAVTPLEGGRFDAQLASGSVPRRQPKWDDAVASKQYFTNEAMGGEGYEKFGGGLKRWRVAKNWNGKWTNTWMAADEASWISDDDWENLKKRPKDFQSLLGEVPPEQLRGALAAIAEDARMRAAVPGVVLGARGKRENAFRDLYQLNQDQFGISPPRPGRDYPQDGELRRWRSWSTTRARPAAGTPAPRTCSRSSWTTSRACSKTPAPCPWCSRPRAAALQGVRRLRPRPPAGALWKQWSEDQALPAEERGRGHRDQPLLDGFLLALGVAAPAAAGSAGGTGGAAGGGTGGTGGTGGGTGGSTSTGSCQGYRLVERGTGLESSLLLRRLLQHREVTAAPTRSASAEPEPHANQPAGLGSPDRGVARPERGVGARPKQAPKPQRGRLLEAEAPQRVL